MTSVPGQQTHLKIASWYRGRQEISLAKMKWLHMKERFCEGTKRKRSISPVDFGS